MEPTGGRGLVAGDRLATAVSGVGATTTRVVCTPPGPAGTVVRDGTDPDPVGWAVIWTEREPMLGSISSGRGGGRADGLVAAVAVAAADGGRNVPAGTAGPVAPVGRGMVSASPARAGRGAVRITAARVMSIAIRTDVASTARITPARRLYQPVAAAALANVQERFPPP